MPTPAQDRFITDRRALTATAGLLVALVSWFSTALLDRMSALEAQQTSVMIAASANAEALRGIRQNMTQLYVDIREARWHGQHPPPLAGMGVGVGYRPDPPVPPGPLDAPLSPAPTASR